ncbi:MAG: hypothetical protein IJ444_03915 [Kiritimatiellae bacterium]|nr:hypothetical protein [Kiritimatiellia bacterium]
MGLQRIYPLEEPVQFPRVRLSLYQPAVVAFAAEAFVGGSFAYCLAYFHPFAEAYCLALSFAYYFGPFYPADYACCLQVFFCCCLFLLGPCLLFFVFLEEFCVLGFFPFLFCFVLAERESCFATTVLSLVAIVLKKLFIDIFLLNLCPQFKN